MKKKHTVHVDSVINANASGKDMLFLPLKIEAWEAKKRGERYITFYTETDVRAFKDSE